MEGQFSFVVSKNFQSAQFQYAQYVHQSRLSRIKNRPAGSPQKSNSMVYHKKVSIMVVTTNNKSTTLTCPFKSIDVFICSRPNVSYEFESLFMRFMLVTDFTKWCQHLHRHPKDVTN